MSDARPSNEWFDYEDDDEYLETLEEEAENPRILQCHCCGHFWDYDLGAVYWGVDEMSYCSEQCMDRQERYSIPQIDHQSRITQFFVYSSKIK